MAQPAKSVLWVDDETELHEFHRIFLQDNGIDVQMATTPPIPSDGPAPTFQARPLFDIEATCYCSILLTAAPYSRNAFIGLFHGEIAARFPDWWAEREDETLNARERGLLGAQVVELGVQLPVRDERVSTWAEGDDLEHRWPE